MKMECWYAEEEEAGGWEVNGYPYLHSEFKSSLGYMRHYIKMSRKSLTKKLRFTIGGKEEWLKDTMWFFRIKICSTYFAKSSILEHSLNVSWASVVNPIKPKNPFDVNWEKDRLLNCSHLFSFSVFFFCCCSKWYRFQSNESLHDYRNDK